ncbi:hypothetical protein GOBAR_AA20433 [Gossypium barbadense]|uniref:Uncharacterized protein n=1 Tax=Gossypium barbadense TaxID=3634 RepID=A0A2P5XA66_GOSBA|nr:hypothetical protein GOBAR_AA20433 [Gossypium barbadense]
MSESEAPADRMRSEIEVSRASVTEMMRQLVEAPGDSLDSDVGCVKPLPGEGSGTPFIPSDLFPIPRKVDAKTGNYLNTF